MSIRSFFEEDSYIVGIAGVVAAELLSALLIFVVLWLLGANILEQMRWFAAAYIAPVMLVRHWAKRQMQPDTTKAAITTLFVTFIPFIVILLRQP